MFQPTHSFIRCVVYTSAYIRSPSQLFLSYNRLIRCLTIYNKAIVKSERSAITCSIDDAICLDITHTRKANGIPELVVIIPRVGLLLCTSNIEQQRKLQSYNYSLCTDNMF